MSSTEMSSGSATNGSAAAGVAMRFESTLLPVSDVDRAKEFYLRMGWRLDIDFNPSPNTRVVQFTPPGSAASIQFGSGVTPAEPGSAKGLLLVVDNIETARDELVGHGIDVGEIWHSDPEQGKAPGIDPERRSYFSRADFTDPDGNGWQLQEITERLPGRV